MYRNTEENHIYVAFGVQKRYLCMFNLWFNQPPTIKLCIPLLSNVLTLDALISSLSLGADIPMVLLLFTHALKLTHNNSSYYLIITQCFK